MHAADFRAAAAEMDMGVDEAGEDRIVLRIDLSGGGADPFLDFIVGADGGDVVAGNGEGLRSGVSVVNGPDVSVEDLRSAGACCWARRSPRNQEGTRQKKKAFHWTLRTIHGEGEATPAPLTCYAKFRNRISLGVGSA
jgi:hypothetical protein